VRRIPAQSVLKGLLVLIELWGKNFGCFRDEFRLSMLATDIDPDSDRGTLSVAIEGDSEPLKLLRAIAIYGPNGSGKSTVLRAASALRHLISETRGFASDTLLQPYEPFALAGPAKEPVVLGVKAVIDSRVYEYSVAFDRRQFREEKLLRMGTDRAEVLLDRTPRGVVGTWTDDPQFQLLTQSFRPNALLLSLADSLAPTLARGIAVGLRRLLFMNDPTAMLWPLNRAEGVAKRARDDAAFSTWLLSRLRAADVGVVDMRTEEIRTLVEVEQEPGEEELTTEPPQEKQAVQLSYRLALIHGGKDGPVPLSYARESLGTRRLVELAPVLFDLVHDSQPRAAFVDEFDASMHPLLLQGLVRHFNCDVAADRARGQLVFATHETSLLDAEAKDAVLRRDQIYLTSKDAVGAAKLYSVAEFRERNNLNMRRRYLQGRYGALPSLGEFPE
jgi:uncharacterized protein